MDRQHIAPGSLRGGAVIFRLVQLGRMNAITGSPASPGGVFRCVCHGRSRRPNAAVLPLGVMVLADADAAVRQLRDFRTLAARHKTMAGVLAETVQLAPLAEGHDAARLAPIGGLLR